MAYCTESDIINRLPESVLLELTDDNGAGAVDSDIVDAAIADADEEIDGWLAMRYSMPLSSTPAILVRWSASLAVCSLFARREHIELPKQWADRCAAVHRSLERIAEGKLSIDVPDPGESTDTGVGVTTSREDRKFTTGRTSDGTSGTLDNF